MQKPAPRHLPAALTAGPAGENGCQHRKDQREDHGPNAGGKNLDCLGLYPGRQLLGSSHGAALHANEDHVRQAADYACAEVKQHLLLGARSLGDPTHAGRKESSSNRTIKSAPAIKQPNSPVDRLPACRETLERPDALERT